MEEVTKEIKAAGSSDLEASYNNCETPPAKDTVVLKKEGEMPKEVYPVQPKQEGFREGEMIVLKNHLFQVKKLTAKEILLHLKGKIASKS